MSSSAVLELRYASGMYTLMLLEDSLTGTQPVVLNIKTIASESRLILSSQIRFHIATTPSPTPTAVAPPGPTQSGIPANCNRWVMQHDGTWSRIPLLVYLLTLVLGVFSYDMAASEGITLDLLY